jgi:hypothetical protein
VLEIRSAASVRYIKEGHSFRCTYDKTLENSLDGDMTKLSFVLDHEMRCWMLWSSSMLCAHQYRVPYNHCARPGCITCRACG